MRIRVRFVPALIAGISTVAALACHRTSVPLPVLPSASGDVAALTSRGEYIVRNAAVCGQCHASDPAHPDGPLSGGTEFKDWRVGTVQAANLTPDNETGLGTWTLAEIVRAIRNGQRKTGRLLAPIMPYNWLHDMSDADALAVAYYLKSQAPVRNPIAQRTNAVFKAGALFFMGPKPAASIAAPARAATPEYGRYLAQNAGLCAHCHTPLTGIESNPDQDRPFAGNAHPPKDFPANPSNLTPDSATGTGRWSEDDFLRTLRTGVDPRGHRLHPFMPWQEIRRMNDDDLRAIYRYLRTLAPIRNEVPHRMK
jgi:mono/diheme cytochrome c family protein